MTICEKQFIQLLRSAILKEDRPCEVDWYGVCRIARRHHLETMIWEAAKGDTTVPEDIRSWLRDSYDRMIARDIRQRCCAEQISKAMESAGIHYAPIKGAILKNDYPQTGSRFMSDIDFYIRPEDRSAIKETVEKIGGKYRGTESGDEQFLFWNEICIEFHGRLLYKKTKNGIENYPDWRFVNETENRLTEEGYALNLIGHAVHDLAGSGPGIRYILDLWIYRNRHQPQPDWDAVNERLKIDGIYQVASNLLNLSEYLFGEGEENPLMIEMTDYVLEGGLHGDYKRGLASQAASGNAVRKQLFRTRTEFENRYPWLKKYPFLLPVTWVMRAVQSLKKHRKSVREWCTGMKTVSSNDVDEQRKKLTRFGL